MLEDTQRYRGLNFSSMIRLDPDLTPKVIESSETCETSEIYSGYLRRSSTIDSVWRQ